jgi:geranylgeranyl pyrophosphate synthase
MEEMLPREFSEEKLVRLSRNQRFSQGNNHIQSLNKTFSEPIWDLLDRGGKRWRPVLCMLIAELLGHPRGRVLDIAALCEIIHNGTLIVDDIEDSRYIDAVSAQSGATSPACTYSSAPTSPSTPAT